ncbi:MAG: S1 RNA-binding domain-containing protein [Salinivirgaceae bacterium]|nr:S1 RNA-binding domain-containing protein [Salinivirgaceae bacterium]
MRYTTTDGPDEPLNAIKDGSLGDKMGIAGGNQSTIIYIRDQRKKSLPETPLPDPTLIKRWELFNASYHEGDSLDGVVNQITPIGLFITVSPHGLKALLHRSNLPEDFRTSFSIGQSLSVVVMYHRQSRWLEFVNRSKRYIQQIL